MIKTVLALLIAAVYSMNIHEQQTTETYDPNEYYN